jgi:hypothetical protein
MQTTLTSEKLSQVPSQTTTRVLRRVLYRKPVDEHAASTLPIYFDDGNQTMIFALGPNCTSFPCTNQLLRVNSYLQDGINTIHSWELPNLKEIAYFYGFELPDIQRDEYSDWKAPLQQISFHELSDLTALFRQFWPCPLMHDIDDRYFSIALPNSKADFYNIMYTVNDLTFMKAADAAEALVGVYLFCIHRSHYAVMGARPANYDDHNQILSAIDAELCKLEGRNRALALRLRQYALIADTTIFDDLSDFEFNARLVKDVYEHFQPALNRKSKDRARMLSMEML